MEKINFEDGQLTKRGCVTIDGKEYPITEPEYDGATPLSAYVLNKLQDNIEEGINNIQALPVGGTKGQVLTKQSETNGDANWEDIEANEVYIGKAEEAPSSAKIIVEEEDFVEGSTLGKSEIYIGPDEPTTGEKVWFNKDENSIYVRNSNGAYEEFINKKELEKEIFVNKTPFTANEGYTIDLQYMNKQGKHYWGTVVFHKNSGMFGSSEIALKCNVELAQIFSYGCFLGTNTYNALAVGYLHLRANQELYVGDNNNTSKYNYARCFVDFIEK